MLAMVSASSENIAKGLSYLVAGDVKDYEAAAERIAKEMLSGTHEELYSAFLVAFSLIVGRDFFALCQLAMELANLIAKPKL